MDYPSGAFTTSLEPFGWTVDVNSAEPSRTKDLYVEHFYETTPNFLFDGVSPAGWEDWFDQVSIEYGDDYLASDVVTSRNLVGPWALRSPGSGTQIIFRPRSTTGCTNVSTTRGAIEPQTKCRCCGRR